MSRLSGWAELGNRLATAPPLALAVVDPYAGQPAARGIAPELARLRRDYPSATMVAAMSPRPGWVSDARTLGEIGVTEIIDLSTELTREAVFRRLVGARGRPVRALLAQLDALPSPFRARAVLGAAADVSAAGGGPSDLARALGLSPATLLRWCAEAGLPVPRRLTMWLRVLFAAELLDDPGRSLLDVALTCGYSSDRALRRAIYALTGHAPRTLRHRGAFSSVANHFKRCVGGAPSTLEAHVCR